MDVSEKKIIYIKRFIKMFLTEDEVLMGWRHWSKYQYEIFTLCWSLQWSGHCVVDHNPDTCQWCRCCHFFR